MGNCFSSQRGTTGKLSDPTHGTGLTSLHSMQGGPMGPGVLNEQNPNNVLSGLQGHGGPITSEVGVRNAGVGVLNHDPNSHGLTQGTVIQLMKFLGWTKKIMSIL